MRKVRGFTLGTRSGEAGGLLAFPDWKLEASSQSPWLGGDPEQGIWLLCPWGRQGWSSCHTTLTAGLDT